MLKFYRFVDLRPAVILSKLSAMQKYKTKTFPFFNPTRCKLVLKNFQWDDVKVYKKIKITCVTINMEESLKALDTINNYLNVINWSHLNPRRA